MEARLVLPDPDFPMMAVDVPLSNDALTSSHRRQAFAVGQPDFGAQMFQPDECAHDCAPGVRFGAVADTMSPSSRPSRMMIDVPSDAPNFTFTVANESPSRLLTWPEASLAGDCGDRQDQGVLDRSRGQYHGGVLPGTRLHVLWEQALQCASRFRPMRSRLPIRPYLPLKRAEWRRRHSLPRHSPWALRVGDLESARQRLVRVYGRQQRGRIHAGAHAAIPYREQRIVRGPCRCPARPFRSRRRPEP